MEKLKAIVDYEKTQLRINENKVYVIGFSMGGYGSYSLVDHYPNLCAAAAPLSGARNQINASALKHVPFWAFHGARDNRVKLSDHQATVDKLRAAGAYVRFTVWTDLGHAASPSFNSTLYDWMLAQERGTPHNYELSIVDGPSTGLLGFFEPETVRLVMARAPDKAKGEVFTGWTSIGGSAFQEPTHKANMTTYPTNSAGSFADAKSLATTFTMPANDVIVTANYAINPNSDQLDADKQYVQAAAELRRLADAHAGKDIGKQAAERLQALMDDPAIGPSIIKAETDALEARAAALEARAADAEKEKDYARAIRLYEQYVQQFANADRFAEVKKRLEALKGDADIQAAIVSKDAERECRSWFQMADNFARAGQKDKARDYLNKVIEKYGNTDWGAKARARLAEIGDQ